MMLLDAMKIDVTSGGFCRPRALKTLLPPRYTPLVSFAGTGVSGGESLSRHQVVTPGVLRMWHAAFSKIGAAGTPVR